MVVFGAAAFIVINLLVDLLYGFLDPRVKDSQNK
jgi:ABC-type dipeptide/oligopeptide/nickel transport system permease component